MKPKKVTVESERLEQQKGLCDTIVHRAALMMTQDVGAPIEMVIDRVLTYGAAQACAVSGSPATATLFRKVADDIDRGLFHSVTGENDKNRKGH